MIFWVLAAFSILYLATMVCVWVLLNRIGRILGDVAASLGNVAAILNDIKAELAILRSILASVIPSTKEK